MMFTYIGNDWDCIATAEDALGTIYGVRPFIFTWGLLCGIDRTGYQRRYCYKDAVDAIAALSEWNPQESPHPPGPWIKLKGRYGGEHVNHRPNQLEADGTPFVLDGDGQRVGRRNIQIRRPGNDNGEVAATREGSDDGAEAGSSHGGAEV